MPKSLGGGGGGGAKEEKPMEKKGFNWIWIVVAVAGIYLLTRDKN
jgi:hypothetical protein